MAGAQSGLFTRRQARACGYSDYQVRRRIEVGEWHVVLGPVLANRSAVPSARLTDLAAGLAIPGGALAGPSDARFHQIPVEDTRTWIAMPASANPRLPAVLPLRGPLPVRDVVLRSGVRITTRPRTVFDCLRVLPDQQAIDLLDRALQQKWTTVEELVGRVRAYTGRRGAGRLARLVGYTASGARSGAERVAVGLLRRAGIEGWEANAPIHDGAGVLIGIGDLVFRAARVVVEVDGWAYHSTPERFARDRYRQNRLVGAGWTVLRFTWRDLTGRAGYVVDTLLRALGHDGRRG